MSSWPGWASRRSRSAASHTTPTSKARNCRSHSWTPIDDPAVPSGSSARARATASPAQVGQDREDPPVVVVGWLQAKAEEDGRRVLGDGPLADHQPGGDGRVGAALGHEPEYLVLAGAERGHGAVGGVAVQQPGDYFRVHRGAPGGYPAYRVDELGAVQHAVLEQVSDAAGAVGQQLAGVQLLDILGQHEHRQAGHRAACREGGPQALVGEGRRQPHVDDRDVGPLSGDRGQEVLPVADGGGDLHAVRLEQPGQAVPQQEEVFGDDNAHGISMFTTVGPPAGLDTASTPSNAASLRSMPASPVPRAGSAPPAPSSLTSIRSIPRSCRKSIQAWLAPACLETLASSSLTAK